MYMGWTYRQNGKQQVDHEVAKWTPRTHNRMRGRLNMRWCDALDIFQTQWERPDRDRRVWRQLRNPTFNNGISTLNSHKAEKEVCIDDTNFIFNSKDLFNLTLHDQYLPFAVLS